MGTIEYRYVVSTRKRGDWTMWDEYDSMDIAIHAVQMLVQSGYYAEVAISREVDERPRRPDGATADETPRGR